MFVVHKPIPTKEEIENMTADEHRQFVFDYYNGSFKHAGWKPTFFAKMKYKFKTLFITLAGLAIIGLVFVVINFVFVGAQDMWHSKDNSKLSEIESYLSTTKSQIDEYEMDINDGTITDEDYGRYKLLLVNYNNHVKEYNDLADDTSTWYIIPGIR